MDIVIVRGFERIIIDAGAIFIAYLGYRLYLNGAIDGKNTLKTNFGDVSLILTGIGPGIFFMAFGSLVLVAALYFGGAESTSNKSQSSSTGNTSEVTVASTKGINGSANECNTEVSLHSSGMYSPDSGFDGKENLKVSLNDKIGVMWNINDNPKLENLKFMFFHPEIITDSYGYHLTSANVGSEKISNGKLATLWTFETDDEIAEGEWLIELWCNRTRLSTKKFMVSKNQ